MTDLQQLPHQEQQQHGHQQQQQHQNHYHKEYQEHQHAQEPYNDSQDDIQDDPQHCRRCTLPIAEGHAYELGGDRWHMYCFGCSKCGKLLGTSSNFLVLGSGDLVCADCSYACNACGRKILDLAILTGNQAYCSGCFCCRKCKRRIEDLRYARTSAGLFCMSCHERLLARKKAKAAAAMATSIGTSTNTNTNTSNSTSTSTATATITAAGKNDSMASGLSRTPRTSTSTTTSIGTAAAITSASSAQEKRVFKSLPAVPRSSTPPTTPATSTTLANSASPGRLQTLVSPAASSAAEKNRKAVVVETSISSSSSNNFLASYTNNESPDLDRDYLDMNSSDEDEIFTKPHPGLSELRQSPDVPTGLNIQGVSGLQDSYSITPATIISNPSTTFSPKINQAPTSPLLRSPPPLSSINKNDQETNLSRSKSFKSPKRLLGSFMKHKKSASSDQNKDSRNLTVDSTPMKMSNHSRVKSDSSPYHGAALFTTPPIPKNFSQNRSSVSSIGLELPSTISSPKHVRSVSDVNASPHDIHIESFEKRNALNNEINELKQFKDTIMAEIGNLTSQRDKLNLEVIQLTSKVHELKVQEQGHQEKHPSETTEKENENEKNKSREVIDKNENFKSVVQSPSIITDHTSPDKQPKARSRFWKRQGNVVKGFGSVFNKNEMSNSASSYALNNILAEGNEKENNDNRQISAPLLNKNEADELGGNDNRKLINNEKLNYIDLNSNNSSASNNNASFGLIISDLFNSTIEMRSIYEKRPIPLIITRLVKEVEERGLEFEGIYRKSGGTSQTTSILKAFNKLLTAETSNELEVSLQGDINAVTSALKKYLYLHIPEPIITNNLYDPFLNIDKIEDFKEKIDEFTKILSLLPRANIKTLDFILTHIQNVESHSYANKMNYHNLAVVFAPTFTRVSSGERELQDLQQKNKVTEFLLVNKDAIFRNINIQG